MNRDCERLAPLLSEQATGALDEAQAASVAAHLQGCSACREEAAALRGVVTDMQALYRQRTTSLVDERALASLARGVQARLPVRAAPPPRRSLAFVALLPAAAALLLFFGLGPRGSVGPRPVREETRAAAPLAELARQDPADSEDDAEEWETGEITELAGESPEPEDLNELLSELTQEDLVRVAQALQRGA